MLQDRNPLFVIADLLFLFDELVKFGVAVVRAQGNPLMKILIVKCIGIVRRTAGIIEGDLAAVDSLLSSINGILLGDQFRLNAPFSELSREHLTDLLALQMPIRRED